MAEKLGITVEFKGKTTEFERAIKSVNNEINVTKKQISTVNKELRLDPKSVDALYKKFDLLKQKQAEVIEEIRLYKEAIAKIPDDQIGGKQWTELNIGLEKAKVELMSLNKELRGDITKVDLTRLSNQLKEAESKLNAIGSAVEEIGKKFMVLTGAISGLAVTGVKYNAELERQTALFTNMTGSATEAEKILSQIKNDAMGSPFDSSALITANQYLMSANIEADRSRETVLGLANAISATGGGNNELQRMAQNLQQIQNVGKASQMDMRQFAMAGIDIWGILAETTGHTVEQLQDMDITFDMVADALANASIEGGKYYGAMEAQADTLNGKISMLKATISELLGELTEILMPVIKQVIDRLQEWVDKIKNLNDDQKQTITKVAGVIASIGPLLTIIGKLTGTKGFGGLLGKIADFVKTEKFLGWISKLQKFIGVGASSGLMGTLSALMGWFLKVVAPILAVVAVFVTLYKENEDFRNSVNNLVSQIKSALMPVFNTLKTVITTLIGIFKDIASVVTAIFGKALSVLINILGSVLSVIINVDSKIIGALKPGIELLTKVVELVIAQFKLWVTNMKSNLQPTLNTIKGIVDTVKSAINYLIEAVKKLYQKFADTTLGNAFVKGIEKISDAVNGVRQFINNLIGDLDRSINKTNQLISVQDNAARYANNSTARRAVVMQSDGLGIASGGIGVTANIHVNNNGTPIDTAEIKRWVSVMAVEIDNELGKMV